MKEGHLENPDIDNYIRVVSDEQGSQLHLKMDWKR